MKPKLTLEPDSPLWDDGVALLALLLLTMLPEDYNSNDFDLSIVPSLRWISMDDDGDWYGYVTRPIVNNSTTRWEIPSDVRTYTFLTDQVRTTLPWVDTLTEVIRELKET